MIPESLSKHIFHKIKVSLEKWKGWSTPQVHQSAQLLCDLLRNSEHGKIPKTFMESGLKLSRAVSNLDDTEWSFDRLTTSSLNEILGSYEKYIAVNNRVFESITSHHNNIVDEDWNKVASNDQSLAVYSEAANAMGSKLWVVECNKWFETFSISYFRKGGARKHFIKTKCSRQNAVNQVQEHQDQPELLLERDLMQPTADCSTPQRIKILDVGSCYNPIAKSEQAEQFDVTALDLYPVNASVLQCDFLNLVISEPGTSPSVITPHTKADGDTNPSAKRQKVEPMGVSSVPVTVDGAVGSHNGSENGVHISSGTVQGDSSLKLLSLPAHSYDVVTMCLVVSYLPTPEQRLRMIQQARALLISPVAEHGVHGTANQSNQRQPPHRNGLLLIAEKQSIFKPPFKQGNNADGKKEATMSTDTDTNAGAEESVSETVEVDYWNSWVTAVCNCGFELVKYHYFPSSDGRKSHLFAFATCNSTATTADSTAAVGSKMWIKQDHLREKGGVN